MFCADFEGIKLWLATLRRRPSPGVHEHLDEFGCLIHLEFGQKVEAFGRGWAQAGTSHEQFSSIFRLHHLWKMVCPPKAGLPTLERRLGMDDARETGKKGVAQWPSKAHGAF